MALQNIIRHYEANVGAFAEKHRIQNTLEEPRTGQGFYYFANVSQLYEQSLK